ncbi:MAG: hypothetical protein Q7U04_13765 [Bacteriovorax sp.]|nr:hypothetical protein [Bacteriovorax sp.]
MNKKIIVFTTFSLLANFNAIAANQILVLGGGGNSEKDVTKTIFDESLQNLGNYLQSTKSWEETISFNHGHEKTEDILSKSFTSPNMAFTKKSYNSQIDAYKLKISNSAPGEQFLVYIDTHGAPPEASDTSHQVATNDGLTNIDRIKELTELAKSKNVKLAIVDLSCYSGNTQKLSEKDNSTCFISSTSSNNYAYADFARNFTNNLAKGKNLEDVFTDAMAATSSRGSPMINTPAGKYVSEKEALIESSLLYNLNDPISPSLNLLTNSMKESIKKTGACTQFSPDQEFLDLINQAENMSVKTSRFLIWEFKSQKTVDFSVLKKGLSDYADFQNDLKNSYLELENLENKSAKYTFNFPDKTNVTYTSNELLNIDTVAFNKIYQQQIEDVKNGPEPKLTEADIKYNEIFKKIKNNQDKTGVKITITESGPSYKESTIAFYRKFMDEYDKIKTKQDEISKNTELTRILSDIKRKSDKAYELSGTIAAEKSKFLTALYKSTQSKQEVMAVKNPCRDFIL